MMERVSLALLLLLLLPGTAEATRSEHECLAEYAASQYWRSVTVIIRSPAALSGGDLVSLMTLFSHRGVFVRLSPKPAPGGSECPPVSSEDTDATLILSPAGVSLLCPSGALHTWTEVRRSARGGVAFAAVRWDPARRRMAAGDSVDCFGGRLMADPVITFTNDFKGVLHGVHVSASMVGGRNDAHFDGKGGGIMNLEGKRFEEESEVSLLKYMSELLGFSYSVSLVPYDVDGDSFNQQEILLANNTVDMTVSLLTLTVRRSSMMHLSFPLTTVEDRVVIETPRLSRRPFEPKRPFSDTAWIGLAFFLSLISLWMAGCQALAIFSATDGRRSACRRETTFISSWWTLATMVCRQYGEGFPAPTRLSRALLGFLCFCFTFLVSSYYSSVIHSFMALESPQLPYSSVQHGLETGRLRVGYIKGGVMERKILEARDPLLRLIADGERVRPTGVNFWKQEDDQLDTWLEAGPQHGFLMSPEDLERHREMRDGAGCSVCQLPELLAVRPLSMAYSRQFQHSRLLNLHLLRLRELGLLHRAAGERRRPAEQQFCQLDSGSARWQPLGLDDLSTVFVLVPAGGAAALLVLAVERLVHLISREMAGQTGPVLSHLP